MFVLKSEYVYVSWIKIKLLYALTEKQIVSVLFVKGMELCGYYEV